MLENSIVQTYTKTQQAVKEQIFCPMCEEWHENSAWCQAPCLHTYETHGWEI